MGAVTKDLHARERALDETYRLDNADGVRALLRDYNALVERQYGGDYDAVVLLVDLHTAIDMARLTDRQREALDYVFMADLTQAEAGRRMSVDQRNVDAYLDVSIDKITEIYYYWAGHGEGYGA